MDFFGYQDSARLRTRWLVILYGLAVLSLILISHAIGVGILCYLIADHTRSNVMVHYWHLFTRLDLFIGFSTVVTMIVCTGTIIKVLSLRHGGAVVAKELGGKELSRSSTDQLEIRLLNIVEEMAIASGMPIPRVFMLHSESAINAFAAGHTLDDAAIGVTRGAVEKLNRDQLQGVIAHEFSHILNADMKLNIRLIGLLNGILGLFLVGKTIIRALSETRPHSRRSSSKKGSSDSGSIMLAIMLGSIALMIVGSVGAFFARMIQCAVSRQREFLADASAVQFTRNPEGLAGALQVIASSAKGSKVNHPHAAEIGHLFFSEGVSGFFSSFFTTHPPIAERITRLGGQVSVALVEPAAPAAAPEATSGFVSSTIPDNVATDVVSSIGLLTPAHLSKARSLMANLPEGIVAATRDLQGAQAVMVALMLSNDPTEREKQIAYLIASDTPLSSTLVLKTIAQVATLSADQKLPVVDLAISSLRKLSPREYKPLVSSLKKIADSDLRLTLFEYVLLTILRHSVEPQVFAYAPSHLLISNRSDLSASLGAVLSALANLTTQEHDARSAFSGQVSKLTQWHGLKYTPAEELTFEVLDQTLDRLASASPSLKREVIESCAALITADRKVSHSEFELLRAICAAVGCPVPLLVT